MMRIILETHYDTKAAKILDNAKLYDYDTAKDIIKDLSETQIHAFVHSPNWLDKYLVGIARMCVEYAGDSLVKSEEFLDECPEVFDEYLSYVKEVRDKQPDPVKFDREFIDNMSYQEVKDFVEKLRKEKSDKNKDELSKMKFDKSSDYELIPFDSYEELHNMFGGNRTGNGSSATAWCHTNGKSTYNIWTNNGEKMFVLAKKGWEDIPFDPITNEEMKGKDDYGNSLIAIRVNKYGNIDRVTLRCNHEGTKGDADKQYTPAELSKVVGFNVEDKVRELEGFEESPLKDSVYYYDGGEVEDKFRSFIKEVIVVDGVPRIASQAFYDCELLESIKIPDSVNYIGWSAFEYCESLKSIEIPNSVKEIDDGAFKHCSSLEVIVVGEGTTKIGDNVFDTGNPDTTVYCSPRSYAYDYCKSYGIKSNIGSVTPETGLGKFINDAIADLTDYFEYYDNDKSTTPVLLIRPVSEFADDVFSYDTLMEFKSKLDSGEFTFDQDDDRKFEKTWDFVLENISDQAYNDFYKEFLRQIKLKARQEGRRDVIRDLSGISPETFVKMLEDAEGFIDGYSIDTSAYFDLLYDYFEE